MQLKQWVTGLVDLGALQSGAYRLRVGPVRVRALMNECIEFARSDADAKGLKLESGAESTVPDLIETDEARLRQVLLILLDNAVKVSDKGRVSLTAQRANHGCGTPLSKGGASLAGLCMEFRVRDSGPGLSKKAQTRIMNLFSNTRGTSSGAGITLVLAARICSALNGMLAVESSPGQGSTFIVRLPLGQPSEAAAPATEALAPTPALEGGMMPRVTALPRARA